MRQDLGRAVLPMLLLLAAGTPVALAGTDGPARAAKPPVTPAIVAPASPLSPGHADAAPPGCSVGVAGPARFVIDYLQPPGDSYFMRVRPASCAACASSPGTWISSVSLALEFRVPCSQPVEVAVVGTLGDTACAPPQAGHLLRGPVAAVLTSATTGVQVFTVPLDGPVALLQDAYLRVTFTGDGAGCTADGTRPRLVTTSACSLCVAWNYYPADTTDLCAALFPGDPIVFAMVDSCVSPALAGADGAGSPAVRLSVAPNPAHSGSDVVFVLAESAWAAVTLHDVAGRLVRRLADGALAAGEHRVHWDGLDEAGVRVRPGTYFVTVRTNGRVLSRPLLLLR